MIDALLRSRHAAQGEAPETVPSTGTDEPRAVRGPVACKPLLLRQMDSDKRHNANACREPCMRGASYTLNRLPHWLKQATALAVRGGPLMAPARALWAARAVHRPQGKRGGVIRIEVYFGADDDTVADSSERHGGELQEDAAAGRSDQDSTVAVDISEAETPTATWPTRQIHRGNS